MSAIYQRVVLSQRQENGEMCFQLVRERTQPEMPCHLVLLSWWFLPKVGNWYNCHRSFCYLHPKKSHVSRRPEIFPFMCLGIIAACPLLPPDCTSLSSPSMSSTPWHKLSCKVIHFKKRKIIKGRVYLPSFYSPFSKEAPDCHTAFSGHKRLLSWWLNSPDEASLKFFPKQKTPVPGFKINICISTRKADKEKLNAHH